MDTSKSNNNLSNFIKLQTLQSRTNGVLRKLFSDRWEKYCGSEWDSSHSKSFTSGIGRKVYEKLQKIQRKSIESGDLNEWDLTTLTDVLMLTDFPTDPMTKQAKSLERSKLEELKKVRNKLAHSPSLGIENELFDFLWHNASEVLIFFGSLKEDLDKIKFSSNLSAFQDENSSDHLNKVNSAEATRLKVEANGFYKNGEFKKAVDNYSNAIVLSGLLDSEMAILYSNRSVAYLSIAGKNKYAQSEEIHCALQDGKEAVRLNPTWYRGYFRTGNAYFELGKFREALEYFDSALSLSPASDELRQARDNCRMKIGQDARQEHMDPAMMPMSEADQMKKIKAKLGKSATDKTVAKALELASKMIPGFEYIRRAHQNRDGIEVTKDLKMAAKLYSTAASLGNAEGMYNLGILHKEGMGVSQDFEMYIKLMKQAASQPQFVPGSKDTLPNVGVAEAEHSLGLAHEEGIGVKVDLAAAAAWYKKASDHGCSSGSNNLAFLYMSGRGVPLSEERAVQYWKMSAAQGNQLAMYSLAVHYLNVEEDLKEAKEWQGRAIKHGNLEAQLGAADFNAKLTELKKRQSGMEEELIKWEKEEGLSNKGMTFKSRGLRMLRAKEPTVTRTIDRSFELFKSGNLKGSTPTSDILHHFDPAVLLKHAGNGSRTANQILTAMSHFGVVCDLMVSYDLDNNSGRIIHELSECYRIFQLVVQLRPDWKDKLCDIVAASLKLNNNTSESSELDKDSRVCFGYLQMDSMEHTLSFMEHSKRKYPNEKAFHIGYGSVCGFLRKYDLGFKEVNKSLEIFPKDIELLYSRAVHLRLTESKRRGDVIKAYEEFLSVAPPDHRKVPESYYAIANEHFFKNAMKSMGMGPSGQGFNMNMKQQKSRTNDKEMMDGITEMEKYYELGLEAEKIQLPCFLPYDSTSKAIIENRQDMIQVMKSRFPKIKNKRGQSSKAQVQKTLEVAPKVKPTLGGASQPQPEPDYIKLSDPNRILVFKSHREHMVERRRVLLDQSVTFVPYTAPPANSQRAPTQLAGLEPITFVEMDTLEDKVYEGRVIQVTSVDVAGFGAFSSVGLVLEDENGDLHRAFIYKFPETDDKIVQEKLGFGAKMSILNPYLRLAQDGHFGIRVDDVSSLFLHTSAEGSRNRCRFCGKDNADLHCAKCKWANYCSRKCQELDWKLTKHKLICVPS